MKSYITIKKKTLFRSLIAFTVIIIIGIAAWKTYYCFFTPHQEQRMIETGAKNIIMAGNREVAYFNSIDTDSTFSELTIHEDSIKTAPDIHLSKQHIDNIIERSIIKRKSETEYLEAVIKEITYYLGTHGVQDEGYNMIAAHQHAVQVQIEHNQRLLSTLEAIKGNNDIHIKHEVKRVTEDEYVPSDVFIEIAGGRCISNRWTKTKRQTRGITKDSRDNIVCGIWNGDTLIEGKRTEEDGIYKGELNSAGIAVGHGSYKATSGNYYEGYWKNDRRNGFGFSVDNHKLKAGEWKADRYQGEKLHYTSERIYGIDISKYQHGKGKKHYPILWNKLRIAHLGHISKKTVSGNVDYPISFVYIKSTEGTSVRNPYYLTDYHQAHKYGFRTGAYHFFSVRSNPAAQANFFLKHSAFKHGDMPPVLDVEPTDEQIKKIGGASVLFRHIRTWMSIVKKRTGAKPILYISQRFVNKYLNMAPDIKHNYNIWIARYGEYKPDVKLVYWQLCPDGRVTGIHGEVDINVFNGYKDKFHEFLESETI